MSGIVKKTISVVLCLIIVIGVFITGKEDFLDLFKSLIVKAEATEYKTGDLIELGTYPQTEVTNELGGILNKQPGEWKSYNYYSGTGNEDDGKMIASDYMKYKDVSFNNEKYRGVYFDAYRPHYTGYQSSVSDSYQDENGYITGTTYWFKFEPITWRVLNPFDGFVICEAIIDSQPFNNYVVAKGVDKHGNTACWGNPAQTHYANNYEHSSIRQWLDDSFYNAAFSSEEKAQILKSHINNKGDYVLSESKEYEEFDGNPTDDSVFLLSYAEVTNNNYNFSASAETDSARRAIGTDYAKCQGLYVYNRSDGNFAGNSLWLLRSPGNRSYRSCCVEKSGEIDGYFNTYNNFGIRPALRLKRIESISRIDSKDKNKNETVDESTVNNVSKKTIPFRVSDDRTINIDTDWTWDYFNKSASEYDHNLTMAGLLLSQAAEVSSAYAEKVLTDKDKNKTNDFGFEHPKSVHYAEDNREFHSAATFASKQITINGEKRILVAVVNRGTTDSGDFITDAAAIYDGFFLASKYVAEELKNYVKSIKDNSYYDIAPAKSNLIFFITGHSLGGAVSQLLTKECSAHYTEKANIFTYTIAAPNVQTFSDNVGAYTNIHNIINEDDLVPKVPEGYKKYGHCWYYKESGKEMDKAEEIVYGSNWNAFIEEQSFFGVMFNHLLKRYLTFVLTDLPKNMGSGASNPYNLSSVHCPVDITVYNKEGKLLGYTKGEESTFTEDSPVLVYTDGESKYVVAPDGAEYTIRFTATGDGTMTYIQQKRESIGDKVLSEKKFENVEIKKGDIFRADVFNDIATENISFEKANEDAFAGYDDIGKSELKSKDSANPDKPDIVTIIIIVSAAVVALLIAAIIFIILKNKKKQAQISKTEDSIEIPSETPAAAPTPVSEEAAPPTPKIEYSCKETGFGGKCSLCKNKTETLYLVSAKKEGKEQRATVCRTCAKRIITKFKKENTPQG